MVVHHRAEFTPAFESHTQFLCRRGEIETVFVKHFELVRSWQRVIPFQSSEKVGHGEHHIGGVIGLGHRADRHRFG